MTRFKICGLTRPEDVSLAIALGAHAIGFVHVRGSKRYVSVAELRALAGGAYPLVTRIAVIADLRIAEVRQLAETTELDAFQLHGHEDLDYVRALRRELPPSIGIIKALRVTAPSDLAIATSYRGVAQALLLDSDGGSGQSFDWHLLSNWVSPLPLILAGGLTPLNVGSAIARFKPFAVDVASGVERSPGEKCPDLLEAFAAAVHAAR